MLRLKFYLALLCFLILAGCNSNPSRTNTIDSTKPVDPNVAASPLIMSNDIDGFKKLLSTTPNINQLDTSQFSFLHKAVMFDKPEAVSLLLSRGASVNVKGLNGTTPLFFLKSTQVLDALIKSNVNIQATDTNKLNALFYITDTKILEALIQAGINPSQPVPNVGTPLSQAKMQFDGALKQIKLTDNKAMKKAYIKYIDTLKPKIQLLLKYSSLASTPELLKQARNGSLAGVKQQAKKANLGTTKDYLGNTALHIAATSNHLAIVKYLASNKKLLSIKNKQDETPFDAVRSQKSDSAKYLSCRMNRFCKSPKSFSLKIEQACSGKSSIKNCERMIQQDIHALFTTPDIEMRAKNIRFNAACKNFNYIKCKRLKSPDNDRIYAQKIENTLQVNSPFIEKKFITLCGQTGNKKSCLGFTKDYPGFKPKADIGLAMQYHNQACRIKESGWLYQGKQCKKGYAHGKGKAINIKKQLNYVGKFTHGQRTQGKILYNNTPMYDGSLRNGKPNGVGVCFHEGEPEECKYYEGKRIDSLYKQRIEMTKQQKIMDAKLEQMQAAQNQQLMQMQQQMGQHSGGGNSAVKSVGDVIIDKAMDKAVDKLFDRLF